ncbi:MAG: TatD family hydrolase [Proteobacteria bacterium]|nr:TatD family hydrolase [Pseudomonadota bacterium]
MNELFCPPLLRDLICKLSVHYDLSIVQIDYTRLAMELVDTHCHLTFPPLIHDVCDVIKRAQGRGVTRIVVPAYDLASWDVMERLAVHKEVFPALGLHPWAADEPIDFKDLERRLIVSEAVAVGEIGLDFKIDSVGPERQISILVRQLEIAHDLGLPVLLHCRGAFEELLSAITEFTPDLRGILHAFSRGSELGARFVDAGLHLAFGGAVTRPKARRARRSAATVPIERLMLETDAPSIGLDGIEPRDVEPHNVADIAAAIAEIRCESIDEIARRTTSNAKKLFKFD